MPIDQHEPARTSGVPPRLDDPLQFLKGVGPQFGAALAKLNLHTVQDLLWHVPRRWEDRSQFRRVAEVRGGEAVTVCGLVLSATTTYPKPRLPLTKALLDDGGSALTLTWFNQPYLEKTFRSLAAARKRVV